MLVLLSSAITLAVPFFLMPLGLTISKSFQGPIFDVMQSPFDEDKNRPKTNDPKEFTQCTASQKALATIEDLKTHSNPPDFVIGADTVVFLDDNIFGKPTDSDNAVEMLKM